MLKPTADTREGKDRQLEFNRQLTAIPFLSGRELTVETQDRYLLKVNHGLGKPYRGFLQLNGSSGLVEDTSNPDKERQLWLRLGSPWQLVNEQRIAAAATDVTFSGLNGDYEQAYRFEIYLVANTTSALSITLQPNALTTAQESVRLVLDTSPASSVAVTATLLVSFMGTPSLTDVSWIEGTFYAKSGQERLMISSQAQYDSSSTDVFGRTMFGTWSDTSTKVTSLVFNSDVASAIGVNSVFRLYRRGATNQKLKLWVF